MGPKLEAWLDQYPVTDTHIVLGDFNLHHPYWGGLGAARHEGAEELMYAMEKAGLELVLPPGTITYTQNAETTIDQIWASSNLRDRITECVIPEELDIDSDYLPIQTLIKLDSAQEAPLQKRNWKKMDIKKFTETVVSGIAQTESMERALKRKSEPIQKIDVDRLTQEVCQIIQEGIEGSTPWLRPSQYSKPGFSSICKTAQMECKRLKRRFRRSGSDEDREEYSRARNYKSNLIKREQRKGFRDFVTRICESPEAMWKGTKWSRDPRPRQATLPPIKDPQNGTWEQDPAGKADLLMKAFFPPPVTADLSDIPSMKYPPPRSIGPITREEIRRVIARAPVKKAPGKDEIPNVIWWILYRSIAPILLVLFNWSLSLGYYPDQLKESATVVLKKPGKDDYSSCKSYRPIALLNTMGKLLETIIATSDSRADGNPPPSPINPYGRKTALFHGPCSPLSDRKSLSSMGPRQSSLAPIAGRGGSIR